MPSRTDSVLGGGEALSDRVLGKLRDAMDPELLHNVPAMGLDRPRRDVQLFSDLRGAVAFGEKLHDLTLPRSESPRNRPTTRSIEGSSTTQNRPMATPLESTPNPGTTKRVWLAVTCSSIRRAG